MPEHCRRINVYRTRRIKPGPVHYETPTCVIRLDQHLDEITLMRLIDGVERVGLEFLQVLEARVERNRISFTIVDKASDNDFYQRRVTVEV